MKWDRVFRPLGVAYLIICTADRGAHLAGTLVRNLDPGTATRNNNAPALCETIHELPKNNPDQVTHSIANELCYSSLLSQGGRVSQNRIRPTEFELLKDLSTGSPYKESMRNTIGEISQNGRWEERSMLIRALAKDIPTKEIINDNLANGTAVNPLASNKVQDITGKAGGFWEGVVPGFGNFASQNTFSSISEADVLFLAAFRETIITPGTANEKASKIITITDFHSDNNTNELQQFLQLPSNQTYEINNDAETIGIAFSAMGVRG